MSMQGGQAPAWQRWGQRCPQASLLPHSLRQLQAAWLHRLLCVCLPQ